MNPELLRNIWVELTGRRIVVMAVVIGVLLLSATTAGRLEGAALSAEMVFYAIVVVWGTRCAAQAVVEEIAGKTWDAQRLSAIRPWTMVWGKLLGSTLLAWLGGAMCLVFVLYAGATRYGAGYALNDLVYFVTIGLIAHATAMMASLVAVRRRLSHSRFDVFLYQLFGLVAAFFVWRVWQTADPDSLFRRWTGGADPFAVSTIPWWGDVYDSASFYVVSLAIFAAWTLIANYRLMRTELQVPNGPVVWLAFLAFVAVYVGGFDGWHAMVPSHAAAFGVRALQVATAMALITYLMAVVEPKEIVAYRWLGQRFAQGRLGAFFGRLPGWAYAYLAAFIAGALVMAFMPWGEAGMSLMLGQGASVVAAALGFLARDCAILLTFGLGQTGKRSDLAALAVIAMLYFLLPGILGGAGVLFYPGLFEPVWLNPLLAWLQAGFVWAIILRRPDLRGPAPS